MVDYRKRTEVIEGDNCYCFHDIGFDYVNENAEVVIVGITPGVTQMKKGKSQEPREIKREHAFAGKNMRRNLIEMFKGIQLGDHLKISGEYEVMEAGVALWSDEFFDKVEMTSLLKEATFCNCRMFNNPSKIEDSDALKEVFEKGFKKDCAKYTKAKLFIALGNKVKDELERLKNEEVINANIIAIPHPSGANNGRVKAFLDGLNPNNLVNVKT